MAIDRNKFRTKEGYISALEDRIKELEAIDLNNYNHRRKLLNALESGWGVMYDAPRDLLKDRDGKVQPI